MTTLRSKKSMQELIDVFVSSHEEQDRQIEVGNARRGNAAARRSIKAFEELCDSFGDEGREALTSLFSHPNDSVRMLAAAYLLRYCTDRAMVVLKDIAKHGSGFSPMEAFYCMKNWEEGKWHLDPAPEPVTDEEENRE